MRNVQPTTRTTYPYVPVQTDFHHNRTRKDRWSTWSVFGLKVLLLVRREFRTGMKYVYYFTALNITYNKTLRCSFHIFHHCNSRKSAFAFIVILWSYSVSNTKFNSNNTWYYCMIFRPTWCSTFSAIYKTIDKCKIITAPNSITLLSLWFYRFICLHGFSFICSCNETAVDNQPGHTFNINDSLIGSLTGNKINEYLRFSKSYPPRFVI